MRKLTLFAGTVALVALTGCTYQDDRYGGGYYGDGYYGGYDYYGPGYYDPYYTGPDTYFDGTYYFYYDRPSHRWHRRDHGDRDHRGSYRDNDRRGDRDWGRNHDWRSDRNAPWNRAGANRPQQPRQDQPARGFRGHYNDANRGDSGRRNHDRGQVSQPRPLAPPPQSSTQPPSQPDRSDRDDDRDRPHWRDRSNHDHQ
jgi:hypothetical protein